MKFAPVALWVIPVSDLAGVARHTLDVTRNGIPGYELHVLCPEGPLATRLRELGIPVHTGKFGPDASFLQSRKTLTQVIHKLNPHILHSHLAYADIVCATVKVSRSSIRVSTEHGVAGNDRLYQSSWAKAFVMRHVHSYRLRRTTGVIAVSQATEKAMNELWKPNCPIVVVYNGVDQIQPTNLGHASELRLLSLSRLAPEKRIDVALRAFAKLTQADHSAQFVIAGSGPEEAKLRELSDSLGLVNVLFPGHVEPVSAMSQADVLVQLSTWENCSYTLLDAKVRNLGIVASDVGGNPELLSEHQLVSSDDADIVACAIRDAHLSKQASSTSWISVSEMCSAISEIYSQWMPVDKKDKLLSRT